MRLGAQDRRFRLWLGQNGPLGLVTIVLVASAVAFVRLLPAAMVVPALSLLMIAAALGIAGVAWIVSARRETATVSYWDIAGGLMLIGISAALLTEGDGPLLQ